MHLPDLPGKGDVSDWLDAGHTIDELQALVRAAPHLTTQSMNTANTANTANRVDGSDPWEIPIPFNESVLPVFPVDVLPEWLRSFVIAEATATQTPTDLPAILALAVLATVCQKKVTVQVNTSWSEPVNLYCIVSLPPGNRKSAVFSSMVQPLAAWEKNKMQHAKEAIAIAQAEHDVLEGRLQRAKATASNPKAGDDPLQAMAEVRQLAKALAEHRVPVMPRLSTDDVTPERLASMICEQGGRMAVLSAEGGIFDIMGGRYSR